MMVDENLQSDVSREQWYTQGLTIIVVGASGDLAKKKTYPSLLDLFIANLLPASFCIWGYARTNLTHQGLRNQILPFLRGAKGGSDSVLEAFLERCYYKRGASYGSVEDWTDLVAHLEKQEQQQPQRRLCNRLFYLAIPPNVFGETGMVIRKTAMAKKGWSRLIIEKPFGRDLQSCEELSKMLSDRFEEHHLYRIDHYLGKEIVQNPLFWRFSNFFDSIWNRTLIRSVIITFKEPFGTEGRGGYFDSFGIIRDVLQNHLLQILTLIAMEPPIRADGPDAGDYIRDCKTRVMQAMSPIDLQDCLLGQYEGYADDPTIKNKNTNCPTYAALRTYVNTPRWMGVPFILEAGKALNERKCDIRIQFHSPPAAHILFCQDTPNNELVMQLQPLPAIHITSNIKSPGFSNHIRPIQLSMDYSTISSRGGNNPDAYTRLILDVLRGRQGSFVRNDELRRSWELFTPLLNKIENENVRPLAYKYGTEGPAERQTFFQNAGVNTDPLVASPHVLAKL